ncbi:MAG: hypothetical protein QOH44_2281, partial [Actinomycetota bacterium]|nr:hypothetical protein [Actinomycetota bacterium]
MAVVLVAAGALVGASTASASVQATLYASPTGTAITGCSI